MKILKYIVYPTMVLSLLSVSSAFCCSRIGNSDISIAGSYDSGKQLSHGGSYNYVYGGCKKFPGQYLVIVTAPTYTDPLAKSISSPEGDVPDEKCFIQNSPFDVSKPEDVGIENFFKSQTSFLNTCLEAEVTDTRGEIDTESQINCEITPVSKNAVIARGPRCSFKIYENSSFVVHYRLNPSCLSLNYLKEKGDIRPMDSKTNISVYRTADLEPGNPAYDILGTINARVTLQADKDLIPVSTYSGTDVSAWPMQYGTQIEFGKIALLRTLRLHNTPYVFLKTPFLVNNNCPEVCKNGFCTSPCDFYAPVAARMTLKKKSVGESMFRTIDYWYQGNFVPSRFLGELTFGRTLSNVKIVTGDMFIVEAEFSNPALTYKAIIDEAKQLLIKLKTVSIATSGAGKPNGLEGLGILEGSNLAPIQSTLWGLGPMRDQQFYTDEFLGVLNSMVSTEDSWPPFYTSVINGDLVDNPNKIFQKLKVGFQVTSVSSSGAVALGNIQYSKESKIFGNYNKPVVAPPQVKCAP